MKKLPVVATVTYSVDLPISGKKIKIRPFLAKEEKILLMAMENEMASEADIKEALKQIITNCVVTSNVNIEKLPNLDVERIFIELRKRSVSETIDLKFDLRETFGCAESICPETAKVSIKLDNIEIMNYDKNKKNIIMLNDDVGVTMKYPTLDIGDNISSDNKTQALFEVIASLIDEIFDKEESTNASEFSKDDLVAWVENSFAHKQLEEAIQFISNQPYFYKSFDVKCSACGKTITREAKGLIDFFT